MTKANLLVLIQFVALIGLLHWPLLPAAPVPLALMIAGVVLILWAMRTMGIGKFGASPLPRQGTPLVSRGPYGYIRHPMYTGLLLFGLGLLLGAPSPLRAAFWLLLLVNLLVKLHYEEGLLAAKFGEYGEYQQRTKKLVPFIY